MKYLIFILLALLFSCEKPERCMTCTTVEYVYGEPADSVSGVYCGDDMRINGRVVEVRKSLYYVTTCK